MNDIQKRAMSVLAALVFFVAIAYGLPYIIDAVRTKEEVRQITAGAADPKSKPVADPKVAKESFMESCDTGEFDGAQFDQTAYCSCSFDKIVERYGINHLANAGLNYTEQQITDTYMPEFSACLRRQGVEL